MKRRKISKTSGGHHLSKKLKNQSSGCETPSSIETMLSCHHPLGIQPLGNLWMSSAGNIRKNGVGTLSILSDQLILGILGWLNGNELLAFGQCSKSAYCFSCHQEVWKYIVLRDFSGNFHFQQDWRKTWIAQQHHISYPHCKLPPLHTHATTPPIQVKNFFSDILFQPWMVSTAQLQPNWLFHQNIDRQTAMSVEQFIKKYEEPNIPVIITDAAENWKGRKDWSIENFLRKYGQCEFTCGPIDMKFSAYWEYCRVAGAVDEQPFYLFDKRFAERAPTLGCEYSVPDYFSDDLFALLGEDTRPAYRWLIVGPARSGSRWHQDPNATSAWNTCLEGRKKWILYPPSHRPPGVFIAGTNASHITSPLSVVEWFINFYHQTAKDRENTCIECIQYPGETIYVPSGWWHVVLNIDATIAITQNFVSPRNLPRVIRFLLNKEEQVSGIAGRGRKALTTQELRETLLNALKMNRKVLYQKICKPILQSNLESSSSSSSSTSSSSSSSSTSSSSNYCWDEILEASNETFTFCDSDD